MSEQLGSPRRPLRVAVIGSGPSGFYVAEALLSAEVEVEVDVYDRLPAPFGLVRYGVAPDHAKIKKVIKQYERTADRDGFAFFGNVRVGEDVTVEGLRTFYDAVVFANGAQTDRRLGIPGEDLPGSYTATEFVAWYNGHPEFVDRTFDLSHEVAMVIGQGNVAIDVARILVKTIDELKHTDISQHALDVLAESRVREVHMVGRRGPAQAAFSPPEIKEFGELADCDPVVDAADLELNPASREEIERKSAARKNLEVLRAFSQRTERQGSRRFVVDFLKSPKKLLGGERVEGVVLEKNRLEGKPGGQRAVGTGVTFDLSCGAVFRSVGYRGVAIEGVPFDERAGIFPNESGRIVMAGKAMPGLYAAGWIKRGPSGVIGTNKPDSIETAKNVLADVATLPPCPHPTRDAVLSWLREQGVRVVSYDDWRRIDGAEMRRGEAKGKPREKFIRVQEMLDELDAGG